MMAQTTDGTENYRSVYRGVARKVRAASRRRARGGDGKNCKKKYTCQFLLAYEKTKA